MRIRVVEEVAVKNRGMTISNLTRVVHDDDLGGEVGCLLSRVILGIGGNKPTPGIIHDNVFHVEAEIVTRQSLWERLMVRLIRLDFSCQSKWAKSHHHTGLQGTCLYTSHWDSSNPTTRTVPIPPLGQFQSHRSCTHPVEEDAVACLRVSWAY
ncbi:hypothetical protein PVL29_025631 [Vitis rotundifolia]|uniref:Uncharacterized protein n=1 Tax=Vitis rotundifolia TaxID=103349 RepID=A0AA38YKE7_VITRO|nr:hypothetical protein PVL29_025631 [Vitis rotundifolia]